MRLDDLLFSQGFGTRRECAGLIAAGQVRLGGERCTDPALAVSLEGLAFEEGSLERVTERADGIGEDVVEHVRGEG